MAVWRRSQQACSFEGSGHLGPHDRARVQLESARLGTPARAVLAKLSTVTPHSSNRTTSLLMLAIPLGGKNVPPASRKIGPNITTHATYQQKKHAAQLCGSSENMQPHLLYTALRANNTLQTIILRRSARQTLRRPEKKHTELSATSTELRQVSTWGETISRRPCESCNESFSESRTESYGGPIWSLQGFQGTPGVFQVRLRQRDSQQNPR